MSEQSSTPATDPWEELVEVPLGLLLDLGSREEHVIRTLARLWAQWHMTPDSPGMTVPELAEACGLNRQRTERALAAHQSQGWVRESDGVYSLAVELPGDLGAEEDRGDGPP